MYPRIEINTEKLEKNARVLSEFTKKFDITPWAVTKCFCAIPDVAKAIVDGGIEVLADSRIANLKKIKDLPVKKVLLRIPMHSEVDDVVEYADYSLNSELSTLKLLGEAAARKNKTHKVVIMVDMGDLREGVWPDDLEGFVSQVVDIKGIEIKGFGVNLTCYGGVIPDENNLGRVVEIAKNMERKFNLKLEIISGGNSSSYYLLPLGRMPNGINNLRFGEILLLGRETAYGDLVEELNQDVFKLQGQIVELKEKPSVPIGNIGMDAFGNTPSYEDRGIIKRAIVAVGRQDIEPSGLTPLDKKIDILGASSDHTILDVTKSDKEYKVGDIVEFYLDYGCLLKAMTSEYVEKATV